MYINTPRSLSYPELERLQLSRRVIPAGFVFVWADKESIPAVLSIFERKGFFYVENLVWVRCHDEDTLPLDDVRPGAGCQVGLFAAAAAQAHAADSAARAAAGERVGELRGAGSAAPAQSGRGGGSVQRARA